MAGIGRGLGGIAVGSLAALATLAGVGGLGRRAANEGFETLVDPAPAVALIPPRVEPSFDCGRCHARVVREWSESAHGISWLDEPYQEALADRKKPEGCWSCHVPQPLHGEEGLAARPSARETAREHGIDCAACHLAPDGAWLGPAGTATEHHPTRRSATLAEGSDALCLTCHRTNIGPVVGVGRDFERADMAGRGMRCVGCHLATLPREEPLDGTALEAAAGLPERRSHALQTPRDPSFLRRAFALRLERRGDGLVVRIENRAGHRVPGLIGRSIAFEAVALDAAGAEVGRAQRAIDARRFLPVDGSLELELPAGVSARLLGRHFDPRAVEAVTFLELELELAP